MCTDRSATIVLNGVLAESRVTRNTSSRLVHPAQTELPPPQNAFVDKFLAEGFWKKKEPPTQSKCDLYAFTNALLAKRLHVYKWRIDEENAEDGEVFHHEVTHIVLGDL